MSEICRVRLCCGLFADGCDSRGALVYEVGAEEAATRSRRGGWGGIPASAGRLDQNLECNVHSTFTRTVCLLTLYYHLAKDGILHDREEIDHDAAYRRLMHGHRFADVHK